MNSGSESRLDFRYRGGGRLDYDQRRFVFARRAHRRPMIRSIVLMCLLPAAAVAESPTPTLPLGVKVLFASNEDIDHWDGDRDHWSAEDGVIVGQWSGDDSRSGASSLVYRGQDDSPATFDHFELTAQLKITGGGGVAIDYRRLPSDWDKEASGYRAVIDFSNRYAGTVEALGDRGRLAQRGRSVTFDQSGNRSSRRFGDAVELGRGVHPGQWNDYRIVADRDRLEHYINESLVCRVIDGAAGSSTDAGVVALSLLPGADVTLRVKNIVIRPLP